MMNYEDISEADLAYFTKHLKRFVFSCGDISEADWAKTSLEHKIRQLEIRIAALEKKLGIRIAALEKKLGIRIAALEKKLGIR